MSKRWIIIIAVFACVLWGVNLFFALKADTYHSNLWGDAFGMVNSLFSFFAFAGVLYSLSLQLKEIEHSRKSHDYSVLLGIYKGLEVDYKEIKEKFDSLIVELYREKLAREGKLTLLNNSAFAINYINRYVNLGFDLLGCDLHSIDNRHMLIQYRNFGESNLTDYFKLLHDLKVNPTDLQIDAVTQMKTWAIIMSRIDEKFKGLMDESLNKIADVFKEEDNHNNYYRYRKVNIEKRLNSRELI